MIEMTSKYLSIAIYLILGESVYASFVGHYSALFITPIRGCILASRAYFSPVSCLFFEPTSSLHESILVKFLVYCSILHPLFASLYLS